MDHERIVVVSGARTPFVRARGVFNSMPASTLGGVALREAVQRSTIDPKLIDEVYFGIVSAPSEGPNIAREALFDSGLPATIPCTGINRYCASSIEATAGIMAKIQSGQIEVGVAGGAESISSIQALFSKKATDFFSTIPRAKTLSQKLQLLSKFKLGYLAPHAPGIKEPTTGETMGQSADLMARVFHVSRQEQDEYALSSHQKAAAAWKSGFYARHVIPVPTPEGKVIERDTDVREDSSLEKLGKLRPVFFKDGTISAGNASPLTDGASAIVLMKESKAKALGLEPLGTIRGVATAAIDIQKEPLLIAPAYAIPKLLKQTGVSFDDIDLFEIHEAFAAQVLATLKALASESFAKDKLGLSAPVGNVNPERLNIHGGSIPIGHPFGATGTRLIIQSLQALKEKNKKRALISVCAAGGLSGVMLVETL